MDRDLVIARHAAEDVRRMLDRPGLRRVVQLAEQAVDEFTSAVQTIADTPSSDRFGWACRR